jgi:CMP-N-acetylneuraminic acid synthetase
VKLVIQTDQPILRRQDAPVCFDMNASIYVWERRSFYNSVSIFNDATQLYEMPEMRSVDIDSLLDLEFVRFLLEKKV